MVLKDKEIYAREEAYRLKFKKMYRNGVKSYFSTLVVTIMDNGSADMKYPP